MINFLDLPTEVRNNIYQRVLGIRHPLFLFQESGRSVDTFAPDRPSQWPALLYTNRQIYNESSAVLYGTNHFYLVDITQRQVGVLRSFLSSIGARNAAQISHLCINFPVTEDVDKEPEKIRLRDDGIETLTLLRDRCTSLSTVEIVVHYKNSRVFAKQEEFQREALTLIDTHLRAIASLERIVVRIEDHDQGPTSSMKNLMQELGWSIVSGNR